LTPAARAILALISMYQKVFSPYFGRNCRYYPTCSEYMSQAVRKYGAAKGVALGLRRLLRCNPLCRGGYDPVP